MRLLDETRHSRPHLLRATNLTANPPDPTLGDGCLLLTPEHRPGVPWLETHKVMGVMSSTQEMNVGGEGYRNYVEEQKENTELKGYMKYGTGSCTHRSHSLPYQNI